jgi:hypothetical protein
VSTANDVRAPAPPCPDPALWRQFQLGLLPEGEAERLQEHLKGCPDCLALLEGAPPADPLLDALRAPGDAADPPSDAPTVSHLIRRLKELAPQAAGPDASVAGEAMHIDRFVIVKELGAGGMGTVYLARDPQLGRLVAVKVPRFDLPGEAQARQRFLREARAAAAVRHPHVCPIYDAGEHDGRPYVVMAFVEGPSLADRLRCLGRYEDRRLAVTQARQVAEALQAVHDHGIVHRDLKPGNVLLDAGGRALLADFGLARVQGDAGKLTAEGATPGTPAYMAPEQVDPALGPVDARTDVYSLGVVLYQMLTGRPPFTGTTSEVLRQIGGVDPPPPSRFRADLGPALEAIVQRAMARRPEDRYASAGAFAEALAGWLAGNATTEPQRRVGRPVRPRTKVSRRRWLAGAGVLAVIGLLAGWWFWPGRQGSPLPSGQPGNAPAVVAPFKGFIDLRVWEPGNRDRQGLRLSDPGALPLKADDRVRIEAELNRPAYLYVLQIDTEGKVAPVYPWRKGEWHNRPTEDQKRRRLSLPEEDPREGGVGGWKVAEGPPGMETMVLLAREEPLPRDVDLAKLLGHLGPQRQQGRRSVAWFENGEVVAHEPERAFKSFDPARIDDPVLQTQEVLRRTLLGRHFDYLRAVSYANQVP